MLRLLIPVLLALFGVIGGAAAGWFLKPAPEPEQVEAEACLDADGEPMDPEICAERDAAEREAALAEPYMGDEAASDSEFVDLERQFIVPVVNEDRVNSLVVLTLSIEVAPGSVEKVFTREPKLRDVLLRALFDHAYTGGFNGDFTVEHQMRELRRSLLVAARKVSGPDVRDVLVVDIIRQDQG